MKALIPVLIIVSLILWSCNRHESELKGVITNSQTFYDIPGTHSYPGILFFGRLENFSKDTVSITLENRAQIASHSDQFRWFLGNDTLNLITSDFHDLSEGKIVISPDSSFRFVLRTGNLAFLNEDKLKLSDSTYYRNLLKRHSYEGEIYFADEKGNRILMERKESFQVIEGRHRLPSPHKPSESNGNTEVQ